MPDVRPLITDKIRGRTIEFVGVQDECLVIATTDGQLYRIGWRDESGNVVYGDPSLEGVDMRIVIDPVSVYGLAEM